MASPSAILRAAKSVPGAAQPTPPPQGSYPSYGVLPQYTMQPPGNYSYEYGPFLPRPPQDFTSGAFGPFSPILPVPVDMPGPGLPRPQPRRWQPPVGYNLPIGQPGTEGFKLASFQTLKALGDYYSIMRTCLEIRKQEIRALNWDIVLTPDAAKAYRGDRKAMRDFGERRSKALKFFNKPDPNYFDFASWLYACMEQVFVYDSLSLYMCPKKGTGMGRGLLGSDLDCLWAIDGSSIRPLMGLHGEMPAPPAPSYQQFEFGVPRADLATMVDDRDLEGAEVGRLKAMLRGDQLIYLPYVPRIDSPYGFSIVEQALIPIMTGLRKQAYQLAFFDEKSIPGVYISPGDQSMTPTQIRELQDALNAVAGQNAVWDFKIIVLPPGSKTMPQKQMEIVDQADEWIATEVAMVASINPMELGILPKISATPSPFAAREMAQASRTIHQRIATKPTLEFVTAIPDFILQQVCGCLDMRFLFDGMDSQQDLAAQNDMDIKDVQSGIRSIDEVRDSRGEVPWGLPETSGPVVFTPAGPIPLEDASRIAQAQAAGVTGNTGAHAAAQGATGTRPSRNATTIPVGASGVGRMNGPVTQRQARRGGALAPAHAMAEGAPGRSGGKAATAELESLARHLRKGRLISTWEPVHLPAVALASIAEDMAKGLTVDQAVGLAKTVVLGPGDYEWAGKAGGAGPKARQSAGTSRQQRQQQRLRAQQQALARQYAARIRSAFASALAQAGRLIAQWAAGALTITLAALVAMIAALIARQLAAVLAQLWREAWRLGRKAAEDAAGSKADKARMAEALAAFLATVGADLAGLISATRMKALQDALTELIRSGEPPEKIAEQIERILGVDWRADLIGETEVMRAFNAAMLEVYAALGVAYKTWVTANDSRVCPACKRNQDAGPVPLAALFPSGLPQPPQHPRCRCIVVPFVPPQPGASKAALTRRAGLNGEVTWEPAAEPELNPAGGGGRIHYPHRADGTEEVQEDIPGGVPGATAGGEPPRWDSSQPVPHGPGTESGDDASQGGPRGVGTRPGAWPLQGYMGGYWPQGGHGTGQPPMSSPGGGPRGRAPNSVGKAADAASFLAKAPRATASQVYTQLHVNYPENAVAWVKRVSWHGPSEVPLDLIDWSGRKRWAADKETSRVDEFAAKLKAREEVHPVVMVAEPGKRRFRIIDGHHRGLACKKIGWPVRAWIAEVDGKDAAQAFETHSSQRHQGASAQNKTFTAGAGISPGAVYGLAPFDLQGQAKRTKPSVNYRKAEDPARSCGVCSMFIPGGACMDVAGRISPADTCDIWAPKVAKAAKDEPHVAGLMVRAADTGRVLMLQRALDDDGPATGLWENPGGHAEPGETLLQAALREWAEEVGHSTPRGTLTGSWTSDDGIYRGFVLTVPSEDVLDLENGRDQIQNPDGDTFESVAWWDPQQFADNPSMRPELARDLDRVLAALDGQSTEKSARGRTSAEILREYWTHEGHPGPTQYALEEKIRWGEPDDWYRCHTELTPYLGAEGAKGYCNLRHHEVLGYWPAQHARMEREGK